MLAVEAADCTPVAADSDADEAADDEMKLNALGEASPVIAPPFAIESYMLLVCGSGSG